MSEWLPIETAPKDVCILIYGAVDSESSGPACACWYEDENGRGDWLIADVLTPTHWAPLPTQPEPRP